MAIHNVLMALRNAIYSDIMRSIGHNHQFVLIFHGQQTSNEWPFMATHWMFGPWNINTNWWLWPIDRPGPFGGRRPPGDLKKLLLCVCYISCKVRVKFHVVHRKKKSYPWWWRGASFANLLVSQLTRSTLFHLFNEYKVLLRHFSHTRQFFNRL